MDTKTASQGMCVVCGDRADVRNINLFTIGSEGTDMCHDCEMLVVGYIRGMRSIAGRARVSQTKRMKVLESQSQARVDELNLEAYSLRTVAKAAQMEHSRTGDDFHTGNKIVEHGYFNDLSQALSDHAGRGFKLD